MIAKNHDFEPYWILEQREEQEKEREWKVLNPAIKKNDIDISFGNKESPDGIPSCLRSPEGISYFDIGQRRSPEGTSYFSFE